MPPNLYIFSFTDILTGKRTQSLIKNSSKLIKFSFMKNLAFLFHFGPLKNSGDYVWEPLQKGHSFTKAVFQLPL